MAKRKRSISLAGPNGTTTLNDLGLATPMAQHLARIENATWFDPDQGKPVNPNSVKRARRISWVEHYYSKALLSPAQFKAAEKLQLAFEQTQKTPPAIKEINVDASPKPDQNITMMINRQSKYHNIARHIPQNARTYIDHVVIQNRPITAMPGCKGRRVPAYMARLAKGLDVMADNLGL